MFHKRAKRMGTPARSAELQSPSPCTEEPSCLAVLYLPSLTRLLDLSSDLDDLLRDCSQFDRAAWKKTVAQAQCVLKIETERLGLVESGREDIFPLPWRSAETRHRGKSQNEGEGRRGSCP